MQMEGLLNKVDLHGYQQYGADFIISHPQSALFLDCGLGKTATTLTAINDLLFDSFEISKVLVICPLRVSAVWVDEINKWKHLNSLRCSVAIGTEVERKAALTRKADIYIINRENVDWLVNKSGLPFDFDMVVIDELSSFKDNGSKRFKALRKVRPKVKRMVGLTGTPSANGLMDLWAEIGILDMGQRLGRYITRFRNDYFIPDKRNQQMVFSYKPRPGAEEAIYKLISDITISMKNTDYLKLPDLVMNEIPVWLAEKEQKAYDAMKRDLVLSLEGKEIDALNAASLSNKLLQMANGAVYADDGSVAKIHDRKLDALEDIIEAANGKPVLVAYWFKHDLKRILNRFPAEKLDSSDSIRRWNRGEIPLAVIHPASAGHGLNLQAGGSTLVWFGLTWSLELYQQTNARLWRQGQKDTVVIHHIIAKGTIDEDVMRALKRKDKTQTALIEAVKARIGGADLYE
jgi:SNF2 family DNA or RNA helicase